ncbi:MAG: Uma2 family endonuclease [Tepidisphaeraceae bacterium]
MPQTITVEEYHSMIKHGIIPDDATIELLNGCLYMKDRSVIGGDPARHSPLHSCAIGCLTGLARRIDNRFRHLQTQLPVTISPNSEPEPDAAIIRGQPREYSDHVPTSRDALCIIEAAHSSLDHDRSVKLRLYAAGRIPQYIIVNLQANCVEIYSDPDTASGTYRTKATANRDEALRLNLGDGEFLEITADELLP